MKLVVALALLSNAAAFMAPVAPRATTQLKAITTEVRSNVRQRLCLQLSALSGRRAVDARSSPRGESGCPLAIDARHSPSQHRP